MIAGASVAAQAQIAMDILRIISEEPESAHPYGQGRLAIPSHGSTRTARVGGKQLAVAPRFWAIRFANALLRSKEMSGGDRSRR